LGSDFIWGTSDEDDDDWAIAAALSNSFWGFTNKTIRAVRPTAKARTIQNNKLMTTIRFGSTTWNALVAVSFVSALVLEDFSFLKRPLEALVRVGDPLVALPASAAFDLVVGMI